VRLSWLENAIHALFIRRTISTRIVLIVFGMRSGSLVGLCMQGYKSQSASVTYCVRIYFNHM